MGDQLVKQGVDELAGLGLDIRLDVELGEWLLDSFFAEDVRELVVYMHIEEDIFSLKYT